jgi:hypothetical protein
MFSTFAGDVDGDSKSDVMYALDWGTALPAGKRR